MIYENRSNHDKQLKKFVPPSNQTGWKPLRIAKWIFYNRKHFRNSDSRLLEHGESKSVKKFFTEMLQIYKKGALDQVGGAIPVKGRFWHSGRCRWGARLAANQLGRKMHALHRRVGFCNLAQKGLGQLLSEFVREHAH